MEPIKKSDSQLYIEERIAYHEERVRRIESVLTDHQGKIDALRYQWKQAYLKTLFENQRYFAFIYYHGVFGITMRHAVYMKMMELGYTQESCAAFHGVEVYTEEDERDWIVN